MNRFAHFLTIAMTILVCHNAFAEVSLKEIEKWKNTGSPNFPYEYSEYTPADEIVAENARYAVIFKSAGNYCPAGRHFLADKQNRSYISVDSNTCDDRKFKVAIKDNVLFFKNGSKVTAKYTLAK